MTIGGNIASKIGDLIPLLLVLDAELIVYQKEQIRLPLGAWLVDGDFETAIVTRVIIPRVAESVYFTASLGDVRLLQERLLLQRDVFESRRHSSRRRPYRYHT